MNAFGDAVAGLSDVLTELQAVSDRLAGVTTPTDAGQYGISDLALHEGVLDILGSAAPPEMSLDVVAAPKTCGGILSGMAQEVYSLNADVIANSTLAPEAAVRVQAMQDRLREIMAASAAALARGEALAQEIAIVHCVAGSLVSGSPALAAMLKLCIQPNTLKVMQDAMTERLTIRPNDEDEAPKANPGKTTCV